MTARLFAGVDEAGRGPVIGPLVIAVAVFDRSGIEKLSELNVRDSKKISPSRRQTLEPQIKRLAAEWKTIQITPAEIDRLRKEISLNQVEAEKTAELLMSLKSMPWKVTVDACDSNADDYGVRVTKHIHEANEEFRIHEFVSEHKADDKYVEVSAASVLAKVERDRIVEDLKKEYGDFGSGYPADPQTQQWLSQLRGKSLPDIVRKSWNTVNKQKQTSLEDF